MIVSFRIHPENSVSYLESPQPAQTAQLQVSESNAPLKFLQTQHAIHGASHTLGWISHQPQSLDLPVDQRQDQTNDCHLCDYCTCFPPQEVKKILRHLVKVGRPPPGLDPNFV